MSDMDGYRPDGACPQCGDDETVCLCPHDLDAPALCLHGVEMGGYRYCPDCAVAGETMLAVSTARALRRIQQDDDETMGAALAARFGG